MKNIQPIYKMPTVVLSLSSPQKNEISVSLHADEKSVHKTFLELHSVAAKQKKNNLKWLNTAWLVQSKSQEIAN